MSQPADDHLKTLWKGQETETATMTAQAIRMLVKDYQAASRQKIFVALGISILCALFFAWCARVAPNGMVRAGDLIMLVWTPAMAWIIWRRRPAGMPGDETSAMDLLDFHRAQVARQAPNLRLIGLQLLPLLTGMVVILVGVWPKTRQLYPQMLPPLILLGIWVVIFVMQLRRQSRRVRDRLREIDALRG